MLLARDETGAAVRAGAFRRWDAKTVEEDVRGEGEGEGVG